jgi:type VI secretion system protein ImpH
MNSDDAQTMKPAAQPAADGDQAPKELSRLAAAPHSYDFFQAVRVLARHSRHAGDGAAGATRPIGHDFAPSSEVVRLRALPALTFPSAEIAGFAAGEGNPEQQRPAELVVSFFGLYGPAGVLPRHYTQVIIDRIRLKDHALRNFLDLFNHRLLSLYYRAWEKHHLPALLEKAHSEDLEDPVTSALYCLAGLGAAGTRRRLEISDETFLYYSGLFAQYPRNASSLQRLLAERFGLPVTILQFQGQWLQLDPGEQTALPTDDRPAGLNCQLGITAVAGERVWSVESRFRIRVGPVGHGAFEELTPGSLRLEQLGQLTRTYVGPEFDFDVQPVLKQEEVPWCQLRSVADSGPRLGWNSWLRSVARRRDADEAVFCPSGNPTR